MLPVEVRKVNMALQLVCRSVVFCVRRPLIDACFRLQKPSKLFLPASSFPKVIWRCTSNSIETQPGHDYTPETSLSRPPWPEVKLPDLVEEAKQHTELVQKVNDLIAEGEYGRLFAVVHFAGRQWKVTNEDLIQIENEIDVQCGDRIRLEKVLLVGGDDFTLVGKPLLGIHSSQFKHKEKLWEIHLKKRQLQKSSLLLFLAELDYCNGGSSKLTERQELKQAIFM
ncbi:39S ribosomal protein L21, mitochondrial-like [Protopterus annectens]|uniref:39S ribosomal protein L21, mitochondrial-like n=1 Tax=Protopterus annectens TaxID=7888 RepID=UPI001CFC0074|nr:39S ribosomal protein L21, mitochondrial-like [Protopterus annectens]